MDEEISIALKEISPQKVPNLDGFQGISYKKALEVVGPSVTAYVRWALEEKERLGINSEALLVLIPKVESPSLFT